MKAHVVNIQPLGDVAAYLRDGWPKCHGYTMHWITQKELGEGDR